MTFTQTVQFLYNLLLNYENKGGGKYKFGLDNMITICAALGNPERKFNSIHIAGTNGKGSVSTMIAAVLTAAGCRTGLYTSPHLLSFCERIKVDGCPIPENEVVYFVENNCDIIYNVCPTFFEISTAMAFWWFEKCGVQWAVIEAGLGGRLDSTNVIVPKVSVITRIAHDHCELLGSSLEQIATEKAGIIKENVPIVVGIHQKETEEIFRTTALSKNAPLIYAQDEYQIVKQWCDEKQYFRVQKISAWQEDFVLDLRGEWQGENLCTALCAMDYLPITAALPAYKRKDALRSAAHCMRLQGRWQILQTKPMIVADIAHNADGLARTMAQIRTYIYGQLYIVLGIMTDKNLNMIVKILPHDAIYYFTNAKIPRAMPAELLAKRCRDEGLKGEIIPSVEMAVIAALENAGQEDFIYIGGSAMVVAEIIGIF